MKIKDDNHRHHRSDHIGWKGLGRWQYSKRESLWCVLVFIIPFLTFKILVATSEAVSDFTLTGQFNYPDGYVAIAIIILVLCSIVPLLLKNSESELQGKRDSSYISDADNFSHLGLVRNAQIR